MFFITSLIPLQTKLYQTERSLSESWRARSKTRSGFDVASVTASQPWANYRVLTDDQKALSTWKDIFLWVSSRFDNEVVKASEFAL
jgi:hypothetical protein